MCTQLYFNAHTEHMCMHTVCTHWANSLNDPKLVMPGTGSPIWGKYNPSSSLTLRLNKGKLQCPSRKSLYENRSCSVPHSGVCNHRLQGTNKMTFHTPLRPTVSIRSLSCWTVGGFFHPCCVAFLTETHFMLCGEKCGFFWQKFITVITHQHEIKWKLMMKYSL